MLKKDIVKLVEEMNGLLNFGEKRLF